MNIARQNGKGQALAEFAMVLPIFAILLFGIIDLGRYVYTANAVNNGAREAARASAVSVRPAECSGISREACAQTIASTRSWAVLVDPSAVDVSCERFVPDPDNPGRFIGVDSTGSCRTADLLTVQVEVPFTLVTPLIAQFIGSFDIGGEAKVTVN